MKPDLQIYFDAKTIEALVGTIEEIPEPLHTHAAEINTPINKEPSLLSFFFFKRSKGRPIRLSEQTIHAYRSLFYSKYGDCRELFEWITLIMAGENARREYKIQESEIFYNHALEVAQRFLPSDVVAHSLLSVYWSHYLYAWCKQDESGVDKALISRERLIGFLEKIAADQLKNESINGLHFYVDPRIEMLKFLDQHNVQPTNDEEQDLKKLQSILSEYIECNYNYKHSVSLTKSQPTSVSCKRSIKAPQSVLSYRCRMYLPRDAEETHFIPEPSYAPRNDTEIELLSNADPYKELYGMVREHCYPEPPNFHISRFKDWFQDLDPGQFQEGAIKETIKERWSYFIKDRNQIIKSYCKENRLDRSSFPPPVLTKTKESTFTHFGPKNTWIDKIDRWLRKMDVYVAFSIRSAIIIAALLDLLILHFILEASFWTQIKFLFIATAIFVFVEIPVKYFSCKSALRKAKSEPIIRPAHENLSILLRDLKDWGKSLVYDMRGSLRMLDLGDVTVTTRRSRPHPDKKAYLISIAAELAIKPKRFSTVIHPEKIALNIQIVGESVNSPHIFVFWFESPKSILLAESSLRVIEYVKDEICRLLLCRLDSHDRFIYVPGDKKSWCYPNYEDRVLIHYWPKLLVPRFTVDGKVASSKEWILAIRNLQRRKKE